MDDTAELADIVYTEIINILFVLRAGRKQEVVERKQILGMLFGEREITQERRRVVIDVLNKLEHDKKIKLTGGMVTHWNYRLTGETWAELSGQMKKAMGDK